MAIKKINKILNIIILALFILCGCNKNIPQKDLEQSSEAEGATETSSETETTTVTTEKETTEDTTTVEPTTNAEVITGENLLQSAMLNEIYITNIQYPQDKRLFKDLYWEWTEFSVVDVNFDGRNDVCLFTSTELDHVRILFQTSNKVVVGGINTTTIFEDGYGGSEDENSFVRMVALAPNQEEKIVIYKAYYSEDAQYYQYKDSEITKEEFEELKKNYSTIPATRYQVTEENIRTYVK